MHAIVGFEEPTPEREQLPVGGMIQRFDSRDSLRELRMVLSEVRGELILGVRRPCNENRPRMR